MVFDLSRRQNVAGGFAAFVAAMSRFGRNARADAAGADVLIAQFTRGRTPAIDKIQLNVPATTDNGNAVPIKVTVDSSMTPNSHVTAVLVVTDGNSRPGVVTFHFSLDSGVAEASTRIRLAKTTSGMQNVIAVAKLNDGSCFKAVRQITITGAGCT